MSGAAIGDFDRTGASPRRIKGTFCAIATARSGAPTPIPAETPAEAGDVRNAPMARLSHPSALPSGSL